MLAKKLSMKQTEKLNMKPNDKVTVFGFPGTIKKEYNDHEWVVLYTNASGQQVLARVNKHDVKPRSGHVIVKIGASS